MTRSFSKTTLQVKMIFLNILMFDSWEILTPEGQLTADGVGLEQCLTSSSHVFHLKHAVRFSQELKKNSHENLLQLQLWALLLLSF